MAKYLVTGATGFIGGQVARQLVQSGHDVVAIARQPARATELSALGIQVVGGDITDRDSLRAPMTGVDGDADPNPRQAVRLTRVTSAVDDLSQQQVLNIE